MEFLRGASQYLQVKLKAPLEDWLGFDHPALVGKHVLETEGLVMLVFRPGDINEILRAVLDYRPGVQVLETGLSPSPGPLFGYRRRYSERLRVVSPGQGVEPRPGEIVIKSNLSFGSGFHPTTELSILLLEEAFRLRKVSTVFDLGTGSGILALAAVHLGAEKVLAADIDARACVEAKENVCLNRKDGQILVVSGSLDCARPAIFDLLLANLTIGTILTLAPSLPQPLRPGGLLLLSGFVEAQQNDVLRAFPQAQLLYKQSLEGWQALLLSL